jgi:hypothetical protein
VHIHVAEGAVDADAGKRLATHADASWLLVHAVHLDDGLPGTIAHNPRSNMHNAVGYARPRPVRTRSCSAPTAIGGDMLDEFRVAFVRHREDDVTASPDPRGRGSRTGTQLVPEAASRPGDRGRTSRWSPGSSRTRPTCERVDVEVGGEVVLRDGVATRVDAVEVRAKAAEQARRLHGCYDRLMATPVALYLQDAHPLREAMGYVQYAERTRFDAVWQAESRLVREATVPDGRVRRGDRAASRIGVGRRRLLDAQRRTARIDVLDARRPRSRSGDPRDRGVVGSARPQGRRRPARSR